MNQDKPEESKNEISQPVEQPKSLDNQAGFPTPEEFAIALEQRAKDNEVTENDTRVWTERTPFGYNAVYASPDGKLKRQHVDPKPFPFNPNLNKNTIDAESHRVVWTSGKFAVLSSYSIPGNTAYDTAYVTIRPDIVNEGDEIDWDKRDKTRHTDNETVFRKYGLSFDEALGLAAEKMRSRELVSSLKITDEFTPEQLDTILTKMEDVSLKQLSIDVTSKESADVLMKHFSQEKGLRTIRILELQCSADALEKIDLSKINNIDRSQVTVAPISSATLESGENDSEHKRYNTQIIRNIVKLDEAKKTSDKLQVTIAQTNTHGAITIGRGEGEPFEVMYEGTHSAAAVSSKKSVENNLEYIRLLDSFDGKQKELHGYFDRVLFTHNRNRAKQQEHQHVYTSVLEMRDVMKAVAAFRPLTNSPEERQFDVLLEAIKGTTASRVQKLVDDLFIESRPIYAKEEFGIHQKVGDERDGFIDVFKQVLGANISSEISYQDLAALKKELIKGIEIQYQDFQDPFSEFMDDIRSEVKFPNPIRLHTTQPKEADLAEQLRDKVRLVSTRGMHAAPPYVIAKGPEHKHQELE